VAVDWRKASIEGARILEAMIAVLWLLMAEWAVARLWDWHEQWREWKRQWVRDECR
jgi:hypothetical protein